MDELANLAPTCRDSIGDLSALLANDALRGRVGVLDSARVAVWCTTARSRCHDGAALARIAEDAAAAGAVVVALRDGECLLIGDDAAATDRLVAAAAPSDERDAFIVDRSDGHTVLELTGDLDAWLARLVDAAALPSEPGSATRLRFVDVAAVVVRRGSDRAWLVVDRGLDHYVCEWLAYAALGAASAAAN